MNLEKEIFEIELKDIMPNRFQPREIFDDEPLQELALSIKEHGVIQPIIVRKVGDKYEIIAGERRYRASQLAGKQTIPALIRDIDDKEAAKIALLENLQRKDLTPIEEAKTYQTILKLDNITQEELAQNLGKSQSAIANKLRLLNLDEEVQTALLNSQISERHARSLLTITKEEQRNLLNKILNERLTVRQVDEEIGRITGRMPQNDEEYQPQENEQEIINQNQPLQTIQPINTEVLPEINNNQYQNENQINQTSISQEPTIEPQPQEIPNQTNIEQPNNNQIPTPQETQKFENIFDKLRVNTENIINESQNNQVIDQEPNQTPIEPNYNNIYDLRFAINNFRQAIQNTEKFGFKVQAEEYDNKDSYQIVIKIDKNN